MGHSLNHSSVNSIIHSSVNSIIHSFFHHVIRSYKIIIESIRAKAEGRTCHFKAHSCSSYESYLKEECQNCGEGCTFIGPDALVTRPKTDATLVKMYLLTLSQVRRCAMNHRAATWRFKCGQISDDE